MALYDMYAQYRDPNLTEDERLTVEDALEKDSTMRNDPELNHEPGGVRNASDGVFFPYPLVQAHIGIAMARAQAQFSEFDRQRLVMPEDQEVGIRFPGVDPVGKYSVIDMKFAQREANLRAALESRSPEVRAYVNGLLDRCGDRQSAFYDVRSIMLHSSMRHRQVTRASKLCLDADGRRLLHQQARVMETDLPVEQYDKLMQGLEYAAGVRQGPVPGEITDFYRDRLHAELDLGIVNAARSLDRVPDRLQVEFQSLDNKLLQSAFAHPGSWGSSPAEVERLADSTGVVEIAEQITPYAAATANRVIEPLFAAQERATGGAVNRADLIIIDGKTVREKMFEDYTASGQNPLEFEAFFKKHSAAAANEYVAAGLMAGKRVEAFVPDRMGRIPDEPTQITRTGYEPTPLRPERFNAWQRHFAKRGFFKEKVARQTEYERMTAARERVKATARSNELLAAGGTSPLVKDIFFGGWARDNGGQPDFASDFSIDRSALHTMAVSRMLMEGRSLEDIYDPNALPAEKDAMGREVCRRLKDGDMKWAGETLFHGLRLLGDEIDRRTAGMDFADENQIFSRGQTLTALASTTAFDICQECARSCCKNECLAAAEAYAAQNCPGQTGREYFSTLHAGVNAAAMYFDFSKKALRDRPILAGGTSLQVHTGNYAGHLASFEAAKTHFAAARAAAPEKGMCGLFPKLEMTRPFYSVDALLQGSSKDFRSFMDRLGADSRFRREVGQELMRGRLQERVRVTADPASMKASFKVAPPTEKGDLELRTPAQLAAAGNAPKKQAPHKQPPQVGGPKR